MFVTALATLLSVPAPRPDLLVSAEWLVRNRSAREVVIFHVAREQADYDRGHVPGARFLPARSLWVTTGPGVELPPVTHVDSLFESLGVSDQSRIILYGDTWTTPRAFLALDYIGLGDRTAILNGGLAAWIASGGTTTTDPSPPVLPGVITPKPKPEIVAEWDWIRARLGDPNVALIDARTPAEYAGTTEVERLPRYGHLPGAKSLPWTETFTAPAAADSGRATMFLEIEQLRAMWAKVGATPGKQVVTYCTVGLRASHMYFVARLLGFEPKIYDGSMRDWSARAELPIVGPSSKPPGETKPHRR